MDTPPPDFQKYSILFVDDEPKTRKYFAKLFGGTFRVIVAGDGLEGMERFLEHQDDVGVVVTDERMPNECGRVFLAKVAELKPATVRILSTAYYDDSSESEESVFCSITKPWDVPDIEVTLKRAMALFIDRNEGDQ